MRGTLNQGVFTKLENENQKLRMGGGSWSINLDELPDGTKEVQYMTPAHVYRITLEKAMKVGFIRIMGGERKLIVSLKHWQLL